MDMDASGQNQEISSVVTDPPESLSLRPLFISHGVMLGIGLGWGFPGTTFSFHGGDLLWGIACGILLRGCTPFLVRRIPAFRELELRLRRLFSGMPMKSVVGLTISGVLAEEVLFRGAMLEHWGWLWSTLIFGVVHGGLWGKWAVWSVWAAVAGAAFGGLVLLTGSLWSAVFAHAWVNFWTLRGYATGAGKI